jgi:NADH-quinone oxidoreductase subunit L
MDDTLRTCLILVPALPLAAAGLVAVLGPRVLGTRSHWPLIVALLGSLLCSLVVVREVAQGQAAARGAYEQVVTLWTWAEVPAAYRPAAPDRPADAPLAALPFGIDVTLRADALTALMLGTVTFVALLVALYSAGYMAGERGYWRYFSYLGLFVFSMTMLVSVSNFVLLFVFWEAVGVCSYLLIGFWYAKPEAAAAGKKAFLVNRVGDFGFTAALLLLWTTYGTLDYHDRPEAGLPQAAAEAGGAAVPAAEEPRAGAAARTGGVRGILSPSRIAAEDYVRGGVATAICLLLLLGACGKSAQFPLHVWLPDAMEGPTPVSALIHAATMVTAGVYLVARCAPLFAASPTAQLVVAMVGGGTALLAALIALTQFDLKRVLAYSTISQLGYMFLALGTGTFSGVTGGMYHLFTHAFFKALLFLGAGSVMHAMGGVIDMRQIGGLARLMPWTHATFLVGCLALAGVFPFAGFWSKDAVLAAVHDRWHDLQHARHLHSEGGADAAHRAELRHTAAAKPRHGGAQEAPDPADLARAERIYGWLYRAALLTALLTAIYTFRAYCLTFHGPLKVPPQAGHHAEESPPVMVWPLVLLAVGSALAGLVCLADASNWGANRLVDFLGATPSLAVGPLAATRVEPEFHVPVAGASTLAALTGIGVALYLFLGEARQAEALRRLWDLEGIEAWTDPQWVVRLQRIGVVAWLVGGLRRAGLGWLVTLAGYLLAMVALVLAIPLLIASWVTPYRLSRDKFYIDELYQVLIVWPLRGLAAVCAWLDQRLIDGLVDAVGRVPAAVGQMLRSLQMGLVQFYALAMVLGTLVLLLARLLWGPA